MDYSDYVRRLEAVDPRLAAAVGGFTSVSHVLAWLGRPAAGLDVVAQDEFCHDLVVPLPDGRWLAFGLT